MKHANTEDEKRRYASEHRGDGKMKHDRRRTTTKDEARAMFAVAGCYFYAPNNVSLVELETVERGLDKEEGRGTRDVRGSSAFPFPPPCFGSVVGFRLLVFR